ncbi:hypothetical protein OIU84_016394 [Salix udensis]|uniref:Uncharacterized protein n=1 Tax=Salix udensis TaxID=889485 RepID=A0AAD6J9B3_9ROSI|nr:hypothetical protein OIU84_016394 [Salix udensis]
MSCASAMMLRTLQKCSVLSFLLGLPS